MAAEQWSGQHIRIWYAIVRVWCSRVPCASPWGSPDRRAHHMSLLVNLDGVDPDSLARSVSSGRGVPTPCTQGRILSGWHSTSFGYPTTGWEKREFRAPTFYIRISHSRMEGEDASTSPDIHIQTFWERLPARVLLSIYSAAVFSWSFLIFPTDILRYFGIFCFRYLLSKSPNSPCNPPIIGFLSL